MRIRSCGISLPNALDVSLFLIIIMKRIDHYMHPSLTFYSANLQIPSVTFAFYISNERFDCIRPKSCAYLFFFFFLFFCVTSAIYLNDKLNEV